MVDPKTHTPKTELELVSFSLIGKPYYSEHDKNITF
jgi:hypothetical protein